jgi:outer membrane protein assembly factor BamE (lipoprotein component of BamABCDE complex)
MRRVLILIISLFFSQFVVSCAYKPDVQQGNTFEEKQLSQLKIGMTPQQVNFIMGTALLKDPFHKNRWDYIYTFAKNQGTAERRLLTLYFKSDRLSKIDDSQVKKVTLE